jgi:cytochrome P450
MAESTISGCPFSGHSTAEGAPARFEPIPVVDGSAGSAVPLLDSLALLQGLLKDPAAQLERYRRRYGDIFAYSIRPIYDEVYYVFSLDAYRALLDTPPEGGLKAGPVRALISTLSRWFPRSSSDPAYLEKLVVHGRELIGSRLLHKDRLAAMRETALRTAARRAAWWSGRLDLAEELVEIIYECSARCVLGDAVWDRVGAVAGPALRRIVRGIEIPRVVLGLSPLGRLTPEHRAVIDLHRALRDLVEEHERTGRYPVLDEIGAVAIDGRPLPRADVPWMIHYILWSAVAYPGTYGFWSFVDVVTRPEVQRALADAAPADRSKLLGHCITETIRVSPVITLARMTTRPLDVACGGRWYRIPADRIVIVTPYAINRDPERFEAPMTYDPWRYREGTASTHLFGRGPYGCVAQGYVYTLLGALFGWLLDHHTFRSLEEDVPARLCNVHLLYPAAPFRVLVGRREEARASAA